jgi:hypothetical protein
VAVLSNTLRTQVLIRLAGYVDNTRPFGAAAVSCRIESPPGAATSVVETP